MWESAFSISIFPPPVLSWFSCRGFELVEEIVFGLLHSSGGLGVAARHLDSSEGVYPTSMCGRFHRFDDVQKMATQFRAKYDESIFAPPT
jgi:hypothetical protein